MTKYDKNFPAPTGAPALAKPPQPNGAMPLPAEPEDPHAFLEAMAFVPAFGCRNAKRGNRPQKILGFTPAELVDFVI